MGARLRIYRDTLELEMRLDLSRSSPRVAPPSRRLFRKLSIACVRSWRMPNRERPTGSTDGLRIWTPCANLDAADHAAGSFAMVANASTAAAGHVPKVRARVSMIL